MNNFELKKTALSQLVKGKSVVIFDKDDEYRGLCKVLNGAYITSYEDKKVK